MRLKHLLMLLSSILFILTCFIVVNISGDITGFEKCEIDITKSLTNDSLNITVKEGVEWPDKYFEEDELVLVINQPNNFYDEITLTVNIPNISYDTSNLEKILGKNVDKYEEYLTALKEGPWEGKIYFSLSQYTEGKNDDSYTVIDKNNNQVTHKVSTSEKDKMGHTETIIIQPNETQSLKIILGSRFGGAISSGTYYLKLKLVIEKLYVEDNKEGFDLDLSFIDEVKMFINATIYSFKDKGIKGLFSFPGIGRFFGVMLLVGLVFYLWKDAKSAYLIGRKIENYGILEGLNSLKITLFNGQFGCSEEFIGFYRPVYLIVGALVSYIILLLTLPIRVLVMIARDVIGLIAPMDLVDKIPVLGNFIGSVAVYLVVFGFVIIFTSTFWIGLILVIIGAALILLGHKFTKDMYCLWDY